MAYRLNAARDQGEIWKSIVRDIEQSQLESSIKVLREKAGALIVPSDITKVFGEFIDSSNAKVLTRHILSLSNAKRARNSTSDEIKALTDALEWSEWGSDDLEKWRSTAPYIRQLLALDAICVAAKVADLSFDYENLLDDIRVITDIRTVFDDKHTIIQGAVILLTLRI